MRGIIHPPTVIGMNKFEAKHPRAKDGKFTEKQREESGIALEPNNKRSDGDSREMPT